jgi:hypothetical protein
VGDEIAIGDHITDDSQHAGDQERTAADLLRLDLGIVVTSVRNDCTLCATSSADQPASA